MAALGLDVPRTTYRVHDGTPYLLVARYDRRTVTGASGEVIERLHQEDLAQALGYSSSRKTKATADPSVDRRKSRPSSRHQYGGASTLRARDKDRQFAASRPRWTTFYLDAIP